MQYNVEIQRVEWFLVLHTLAYSQTVSFFAEIVASEMIQKPYQAVIQNEGLGQ